jgi:hypothetical protein
MWALGCVVVELLTGYPPWRGKQPLQIMMTVAGKGQAPPIPDEARGVFVALLRSCFSHAQASRPTAQQALALLQDSTAVAEGVPPDVSLAAPLEAMIVMGFAEVDAVAALAACGGDEARAIDRLVTQQEALQARAIDRLVVQQPMVDTKQEQAAPEPEPALHQEPQLPSPIPPQQLLVQGGQLDRAEIYMGAGGVGVVGAAGVGTISAVLYGTGAAMAVAGGGAGLAVAAVPAVGLTLKKTFQTVDGEDVAVNLDVGGAVSSAELDAIGLLSVALSHNSGHKARIYKYTITFQQGGGAAKRAQSYAFFDESGEAYRSTVYRKGKHMVAFNSVRPKIVRVTRF